MAYVIYKLWIFVILQQSVSFTICVIYIIHCVYFLQILIQDILLICTLLAIHLLCFCAIWLCCINLFCDKWAIDTSRIRVFLKHIIFFKFKLQAYLSVSIYCLFILFLVQEMCLQVGIPFNWWLPNFITSWSC